MTRIGLLELMIGLGAAMAWLSLGRVTVIELSRRITATGWLMLGVGLVGWAATVDGAASSAWAGLIDWMRIGAGVAGACLAGLGLRHLLRAADNRNDLESQLARSMPGDARQTAAWRLVYAGGAIILMLIVWASNWDDSAETFDGSPGSILYPCASRSRRRARAGRAAPPYWTTEGTAIAFRRD